MKRKLIGVLLAGTLLILSGCRNTENVTEGTEEYRGFVLDNVFHSESEGDIHYNLYVPDSYDGSQPYALIFTLPGYEGLYFQGVGENLYSALGLPLRSMCRI